MMEAPRTKPDAKRTPSSPSSAGTKAPDMKNSVERVQAVTRRLVDEVGRVIVGKQTVLEKVTAAILAEASHLLFEDMPGLGKSVMCAAFSQASGCDFRRIQFTPDLLPGDITGSSIYNQAQSQFEFQPGPIFTNFLLADEINRASPKTQSALLEAMAEKQVSIEGTTHKLAPPFFVMATQNPVEQEGTYPLPEAQMDRFAMRLSMGYPSQVDEVEILARRARRHKDAHEVQPVCSAKMIVSMQQVAEHVHASQELFEYIGALVTATRHHEQLRAGASPRGSLALLKLSRAWAAMHGRTFATPDDVKHLAAPVLAHRVILEPEARLSRITPEDIINGIVKKVPVPKI